MTILLTGSTGHTGLEVARILANKGAEVRALTRSPATAGLPERVRPIQGDLSDTAVFADALRGVDTLFLLVPNVFDELHQTLAALNVARDAGVRGIVYLSVYHCDLHPGIPHFACKVAAERMIEAFDMPASVLRAAFFMQNDLRQKEALLDHGLYGHPVGHKGMAYVDTRDLAEIAAAELLRRAASDAPLPAARHDIVGPDNLTPDTIAALWKRAIGRDVVYAGDDLDAFQEEAARHLPAGFAYDLRLIFRAFQEHGAAASRDAVERMTGLLGHPPRTYADFLQETARSWKAMPANPPDQGVGRSPS